MKKYFLFLFVATLFILSTPVFAQTKIDNKNIPKINNANIGALATTTNLGTSTLFDPALLPQVQQPQINKESFKQGESANCFDYYNIRSIGINLQTDTSAYNPGEQVQIRGKITNNNKYPITNLTIKARFVKDIPNPSYFRAEIITLEDAEIVKNITLNAGESFEVKYSHLLPLNAPKGEYQIFFYAYNNDRFNQSGLSYTNDIVGSKLSFTVKGNSLEHVYLDQTKITLNGQAHNVMAFMTRHKKEDLIKVSIPLVNPTGKAEEMTVIYNLYKWDGLREENKADTKTETVMVPAKGKVELTYTAKNTDASVYFLNIKADSKNQKKDKSVYSIKTESNIRFIVLGYSFPKIDSFGVDTYPIKAGKEATLFTCYQNGSDQDISLNIKTVLYDEKNRVVAQTEYDGSINGNISAIIKKFTPLRSLVNFKTVTTITDDTGKIIDKIEDNYNCKDIDPTLCSSGSSLWIWILLGLLIVIIIGVVVIKKIKNRIAVPAVMVLLFVGIFQLGFFVNTTEAASVPASFAISSSYNIWGNAYNNVNIVGSLNKNFNFILENNSNLSQNSTVDFGSKFNASVGTTSGSWSRTGGFSDTPPMDGVEWVSMNFKQGTALNIFNIDSLSIPADSNDVLINSSDTNIISCTNTECEAKAPGQSTITVSFPKKTLNPQIPSSPVYIVDVLTNPSINQGFLNATSTGYGYVTVTSFIFAHMFVHSGAWNREYPPSSMVAYQYNDTNWATTMSTLHNLEYPLGPMYPPYYGEGSRYYTAVAYSFPDITYNITVSPIPNTPQTSACSGVTSIGADSATVNWTYSDTDGDPQTSYQVDIATDSAFSNVVKSLVAPANTDVSNTISVDVSGLSPNTTYYSRIKTYNEANNWSEFSSCSSFSTTQSGSAFSVSCLASPDPVAVNQRTTFTAYPINGTATSYEWKNSLDTLVSIVNPYLSPVFTALGLNTMKIQVTNNEGAIATSTCTVNVTECDTSHTSNQPTCPDTTKWQCVNNLWASSTVDSCIDICTANGSSYCSGYKVIDSCGRELANCADTSSSCSFGRCGVEPAATSSDEHGGTGWVSGCTLDGVTIPNDSTTTFYTSRLASPCVGSGVSCKYNNLNVKSEIFKFKKCVDPIHSQF